MTAHVSAPLVWCVMSTKNTTMKRASVTVPSLSLPRLVSAKRRSAEQQEEQEPLDITVQREGLRVVPKRQEKEKANLERAHKLAAAMIAVRNQLEGDQNE